MRKPVNSGQGLKHLLGCGFNAYPMKNIWHNFPLLVLNLLNQKIFIRKSNFKNCIEGDGTLSATPFHLLTQYCPISFGKHHTPLILQSLASISSYSLLITALSVRPKRWIIYPKGPGIITK